MKSPFRNCGVLACLLTLALSTGCATFSPVANKQIPAELGGKSKGEYQIVLTSPMGTSDVQTALVHDGLTVQGALEQSGALRKFRTMKVELDRRVAENGRTIKMSCEFQPSKKLIKYEQDYQILPGDRLIVSSDANPLGKMFKASK